MRLTSERRQALTGYGFILPWLLGFLALKAYPLFSSLWLSFHRVRITATAGIRTQYLGLGNYSRAFLTDVEFVNGLLTFLRNLALSTPIILVFSLMIALLIHYPMRLRALFRTIFFLPVIITSGPVIQELVSQGAATIPTIEKYGVIQFVRANLSRAWAEPVTYLFTQIILILWFSGVQILIFLAGLQKINPSMYEAARIDGASAWEILWKVTLPELRPLVTVNAIYTLVTLATFSQNEVIPLIQQAMFAPEAGFGYASALAWVHFVVVTALIGLATLILASRSRETVRRG
jgi:ABC-type sugar transport system permease subunit